MKYADLLHDIFRNAKTIFPEFAFKEIPAGYISQSGRKLTGETGKPGKVNYYANNPRNITDHSNNLTLSVWEVVATRENIDPSDRPAVMKKFCELLNIPFTDNGNYSDTHTARDHSADIWEAMFKYCVKELHENNKADRVKSYLTNRNYTEEDILAMGLGFMPEQETLFEYLHSQKFNQDPREAINLNSGIGNTHTLLIPIRDQYGRAAGISARNIDYQATDTIAKYLFNKRADTLPGPKLYGLHTLQRGARIVLVEGIIDQLFATARGMKNIIAMGNKSLTPEKLEILKQYNPRDIVISLDNEPGTKKDIKQAIELIRNNSRIPVYVAILPEGVKDLDELIRDKGAEAAQGCINSALSASGYLLDTLLQEPGEDTSETALNELYRDIAGAIAGEPNPMFRDTLQKEFLRSEFAIERGITAHSLTEAVNEKRDADTEARQRQKIQESIATASRQLSGGNLKGAIDTLLYTTRGQLVNTAENYINGHRITTRADLANELIQLPPSVDSGYYIGTDTKDKLKLPAGAITIIAGATQHGKTTLLINLALNVCKATNKPIHFFTIEERASAIILKSLSAYANLSLSKNNINTLRHYFTNPGDPYEMFSKEIRQEDKAGFEVDTENFFELTANNRFNVWSLDKTSCELREIITALHTQDPAAAVFIDYIQLLRHSGAGRFNSRQEELKQICIDLNEFAKQTGIPLILGSQFNRQAIEPDKAQLYNLSEAGDIERIANLVISIWNNKYTPENYNKENLYTKEDGKIIGHILKARDFEAGGKLMLSWDGNTKRISQTS